MIIRATIAGENAALLAYAAQGAGLSVTAWPTFGAGAWGPEPGATFETTVSWHADAPFEALRVCRFLDRILRAGKQKCAYVTVADEHGTEAHLYYPGGRTEPLGVSR